MNVTKHETTHHDSVRSRMALHKLGRVDSGSHEYERPSIAMTKAR